MKRSSWALMAALAAPAAWAQSGPATIVYRCPGNVYTSSSDLPAKQAEEKGCKVIEGAPVTIVQTAKPAARPKEPIASGPREGRSTEGRGTEGRVDPNAQRQRDSDARRLLEGELQREEGRLADLKREFNNGEPERQGGERNAQRYLDRVAEMRAAIARKEEDVAAIRRELAKLPQ
jgi:hypothetical protein